MAAPAAAPKPLPRAVRAVLRAPFTRRTWGEAAYCVLGLPLALAGFVLVLVLLALGTGLTVSLIGAVVGLLLLTGALGLSRALAAVQRWLAARLLGERLPVPSPVPAGSGLLGRLDARLRDGTGWRSAAYVMAKLPLAAVQLYAVLGLWVCTLLNLSLPLRWGLLGQYPDRGDGREAAVITPLPFGGGAPHITTFAGTSVAFAIGVGLLLLAPWPARGVVAMDRWLIRGLLGPGELETRVRDLEETRALAVDDSAALLRRLERDLHDGAQVRLVALAMSLDMLREGLDADGPEADRPDADRPGAGGTEADGSAVDGSEADRSDAVGPGRRPAGRAGGRPLDAARLRRLADTAHRNATEALTELRDLARGIHPPVLDDGLPDALDTLAARCVLPVRLTVDLPRRPTPAIETIAYFCAAELLTNAIKHSGARSVGIEAVQRDGAIRLRVTDDGRGGATPGSGLTGLLQRVRTVDGSLEIDSPDGGPTAVTVTLPPHA
ncbi:sensor histidine kinase [Streptomyces armeniacus]|uniref:histidine kinase n=1 Tax=Streptomyces armeniacus TaxID=83291 RepID=A0A345Y1H7_9ACTN|nr:sensor histidine kinase [Streptomyces armeniacus]